MRSVFIAVCLTAIPAIAADIYTFTVPDGVTVESLASLTTGWGYSLHNESSSLWLATTGLSVTAFQHATPDLLFDFPDLAPGATVTVPYDPLTPAGLYQIVWDANAPQGFTNSGTFTLTADWWNGDPLPVAHLWQLRPAPASSTQQQQRGGTGTCHSRLCRWLSVYLLHRLSPTAAPAWLMERFRPGAQFLGVLSLVEAAGVEPASEKARRAKPTCVAGSAFSATA